jgi:uncharacterized protein (DUF488 family)
MTARKNLYTFGYEGLTLDAFLDRLSTVAIQILVDVRELPLSRKPGFSKNALSAVLAAHNITYVHMPALGCPKAVRDRYKVDADWAGYTRRFLAYLRSQEVAVAALANVARADTSCLLCFEADFNYCHRTMVARAASEAGAPAVIHLTARTAVPDQARRAVA